jgi:serine protease inhibitor
METLELIKLILLNFKLNEILINLGIKSAFDRSKANFTGITETDRLYIQEVRGIIKANPSYIDSFISIY